MIATGIGKSVFYAYFFKLYSAEHPATWIIMASFNTTSSLHQVVVKKGDTYARARAKAKKRELIDDTIEAAEAAGHPFLLLYDGPPEMVENDAQMVCFASPNEAWTRKTWKEDMVQCLYIPLWTLEELGAASDALGLDMDDDNLRARFEMFGGDARLCFGPDRFVERNKLALPGKIATIYSLGKLKKLLTSWELDSTRYQLIHYVPSEDATYYSTKIASAFVEQELLRKAFELPDRKRESLMLWLDGMRGPGLLGEFPFKVRARNLLGRGGLNGIVVGRMRRLN